MMFNPPSASLLREAENRDTKVGDVSGLTNTGGGVLGGVLGSSLFMFDSRERRDIGVLDVGVLGGADFDDSSLRRMGGGRGGSGDIVDGIMGDSWGSRSCMAF